jgi:hypothetical protein
MPNNAPTKGFNVSNRAWYKRPDTQTQIMIGLYYPDGGTDGEFAIRWEVVGKEPTARIEVFQDSWRVFFGLGMEPLAALGETNPSQDQVIALLVGMGFTDLTEYSRELDPHEALRRKEEARFLRQRADELDPPGGTNAEQV